MSDMVFKYAKYNFAWDEGVAGSNPVIPISYKKRTLRIFLGFFFYANFIFSVNLV